jgi:hypothetical protein
VVGIENGGVGAAGVGDVAQFEKVSNHGDLVAALGCHLGGKTCQLGCQRPELIELLG